MSPDATGLRTTVRRPAMPCPPSGSAGRRRPWGVVPALFLSCSAAVVSAQPVAPAPSAPALPPRVVVEGALGWAGFGDDALIHHTVGGVGARLALSPRLSIGPEVQYFVGPGDDRDLIVTGNLVVDVLAARPDRPRRTTPYFLLGGGLYRHADRFGWNSFHATEGAFTVGIGVRAWTSERIYVAADARLGWEPHLRLAALVGVALK